MNEQDLELIEKLLDRKLEEQSAKLSAKLSAELSAKLSVEIDRKMDQRLGEFARDLTDNLTRDFTHRIEEAIEASERRTGVLIERLEQKVDMVIEGQQAMVERMDRMELRQEEDYEKLDARMTALTADFVAHKSDPLAHKRGFSIKEEEETYR